MALQVHRDVSQRGYERDGIVRGAPQVGHVETAVAPAHRENGVQRRHAEDEGEVLAYVKRFQILINCLLVFGKVEKSKPPKSVERIENAMIALVALAVYRKETRA